VRALRFAPLLLATSATFAALAACSSKEPGTGGGGAGGATSHSHSTSVAVTASGTGGMTPLPDTFTVTGVVTDGTAPLEGATVMQGGGDPAFTTGADGKFSIELTTKIPGTPTVVATKMGYRAAGIEFLEAPTDPVSISLKFISPPDNEAYVYGDPGNGDPSHDNSTKFCGHCHGTLVKQWRSSAHARATKDPLVQDLYAGVTEAYTDQASCVAAGGKWRAGLDPGTTNAKDKCYLGSGVLPDLNPACGAPNGPACDDPAIDPSLAPTAFGSCADCHAPGINGKAGGRNLHEATGIAYDAGNHCDVCHHAADFDLTKPPGVAGRLVLHRPSDKTSNQPGAMVVQAMFGPLPDVPNGFMGGSWQPKFQTSVVCGGCHEQKQSALVPGTSLDAARWPDGLPTHSTYSEWAGSTYNTKGSQCQLCHMPPDDTGLVNSVDSTHAPGAGITAGFARKPGTIKKHLFRDPLEGSPRLLDQSVVVELAGSASGGTLNVAVQARNVTAGHAIPTGEPMRSVLLLVRATACGNALAASGGMTVDDWGGAIAEGMLGADATLVNGKLVWTGVGAKAKIGSVVRVVRPTGMYEDYAGVGFFANPALSPTEKGREIEAPVGEATITAVSGDTLTLSAPIAMNAGDVVLLGEAAAWPIVDGSGSAAIAGSAGTSFARTLVDAAGARGVPHYRAVDMVSDNRLLPGAAAQTHHAFTIPPGCSATQAQVSAVVLYRPVPVGMARERGWEAKDYVIAQVTQSVPVP
jgi:hypothetical protein